VSPALGTKGLGNGKECSFISVRCVESTLITPPLLDGGSTNLSVLWILKGEEDYNSRNGDPRIKSSRKDIIILGPPTKMTSPNVILESEPNNTPWDIVNSSCRRDQASSRKENRKVDVLNPRVRELFRNKERYHWCHRTEEEEERKAIVNLPW